LAMSDFGTFETCRPAVTMSAPGGIVLQKSFWGDDQDFSGLLMRFARGDMRDHIVSHKNDHGAPYGRYGVLQWWSWLKFIFCEIFGVVQLSTFATQSARSGRSRSRRIGDRLGTRARSC
jgi:hypothetical protein